MSSTPGWKAKEKGYFICRAVEGPGEVEQPITPVPATVEINPLLFTTYRTLLPI
jgi:hypothetical protein